MPPVQADDHAVHSVRAARRYRWRLAGGRLSVGTAGLRFEPNKLERRLSAPSWQCSAGDVGAVRARGRMWLVVETAQGAQTFRVFGASEVARQIGHALHAAGAGRPRAGGQGNAVA